jgi:hypothetical protein
MAGKIGIGARAAARCRVVSGESHFIMEKSALKYFTRVANHPRKPLAWRPFLKALGDVVVSDIEFLATGEPPPTESAESKDNESTNCTHFPQRR